mgnify:CR=1 FL=1
MGKVYGIDVSEHNGVLDWSKLKKAGIKFVLIRSGYGVTHTDAQFYNNIQGAHAAGMVIGIYHFSYALTVDGAKREAEAVLKIIKPYKDIITLPIYFDFEYDTVSYAKKQGVELGKNAFNNHCVAFCETIKAAGYTPGVYYNLDYYNTMVSLSSVGGYSQWYAQYSGTPHVAADIWQKSSNFICNGVPGRFDCNEADEQFIFGSHGFTLGWHKDDRGWWYADTANSYYKSRWAKINGKWYSFDKEGYMLSNTWQVEAGGDTYYLGAEGDMQTNMVVGLGSDGKLQPMEPWYHTLGEVPKGYRKELDKLVSAGKFKGKSGSGDDMVLDMPLSALRVLIILSR